MAKKKKAQPAKKRTKKTPAVVKVDVSTPPAAPETAQEPSKPIEQAP